MDPIQALAILSLGAFVAVLVTALFYVFTVRPRLLDPEAAAGLGVVDDRMGTRLADQRAAVERLNVALTHHTSRLEAAVGLDQEFESLRMMLHTHSQAVETLTGLLQEHASHLAGLGNRLSRQENALDRTAQQVDTLAGTTLPALFEQVAGQSRALERLEARPASMVPAEQRGYSGLIHAQIDRLVAIADRLDAWASAGTPEGHPLAEQARVLTDLDRQLIATAQAIGQMEARIGEHTTMLVTAETERREQASLVDRVLYRVGELFTVVNQMVTNPPRADHDRLTDIKGIGPVYAGKLYEAGIFTYRQLAAMSPEVLKLVIDEPEWRSRAIDAESWIEQAKLLAARREKVETTR
jgi:predicted flap endonuclease-1-like 5' DNA nuclease